MNLIDSFNAFISNPLKFLVDPNNTILEYQVKKSLAGGKSKEEIETALSGQGFKKGSPITDIVNGVTDTIKDIVKGITDTLQFLAKNIPLIFLIGIGIIAFYYISPFLRKK